MRLSVFIINYNYSQFLVECVESVLAQIDLPEEIIIVDDGSTDNSRELLMAHYSNHERIKLIFQENQGQAAAFNTAYEASTGDVCIFLDADDCFHPQYCQILRKLYIEKPYVTAVLANLSYFGGQTGTQDYYPKTGSLGYRMIRSLHDSCWPGGNAWSLKRVIAEKVFPLPVEFFYLFQGSKPLGDTCLVYGLHIMGAFVYYIAQPLYHYRRHMHAASHIKDQFAIEGTQYRENYIIARIQAYYAQKALILPHFVCQIVDEFALIEHPCRRELKVYTRIVWRSIMPWWKKLKIVCKLYRLYVKKSG